MDSYAQTERLLIRNLKDAGCSETDIQRFLKLGQEGRRRERQIDCLDYLVYQMSSRSDNHQGRNMETEA